MSENLTTTSNGPWRILVLDRDPADPKWILALVMDPGDVRPTQIGQNPADLAMAAAWVRALLGRPRATLTPLIRPGVWRIDEQPTADR